VEVEDMLVTYPHSIVGEIGLDGFHFDRATGGLKAPMAKQVEVFRLQMELAAKHQRPVSIHTVQCFGVLMETLSIIKKSTVKLPPKMYFHAFGGKQGTIDQLLALCGREPGKVYFGFAPVISKCDKSFGFSLFFHRTSIPNFLRWYKRRFPIAKNGRCCTEGWP
jgi:Tat protein secretion system quality control protein TatD with DNase activity